MRERFSRFFELRYHGSRVDALRELLGPGQPCADSLAIAERRRGMYRVDVPPAESGREMERELDHA